MHIFHKWSRWAVNGTMKETTIPTGGDYPLEVIGKKFVTNHTIQSRTCDVCGKTQVQKLSCQ